MKPLNQNLVELVKLLNDGEYHDGSSIGDKLKVTRSAVWKAVKKLEQYAIPLTSTKGKGYRLNTSLNLLDPMRIKSLLRHNTTELAVFEKLASTNEYLKQFVTNNKKIIACLAEVQTTGKGRFHRHWHSPFAKNIYFSLLCPFEKDVSELSGLSLVASLAVCKAIESTIDLPDKKLSVKWPNDILIENDKLAGTLIEMQVESNGSCQVIIGVGLNVNMQEASQKEIDQTWTSLFNITGQYIDRNSLSANIIDTLIDYLERFSSKGLKAFHNEWQARDCLTNSMIALTYGQKKIEGICHGINDQGHLTIKADNDDMLSFSSGDATLSR